MFFARATAPGCYAIDGSSLYRAKEPSPFDNFYKVSTVIANAMEQLELDKVSVSDLAEKMPRRSRMAGGSGSVRWENRTCRSASRYYLCGEEAVL